jgi:hypothetical protein
MGIHEVRTAPRSPWQNSYVERFIGSVRRECLDHVLVFNEAGLGRVLEAYRGYYERSRTHLALAKDTPIPRPITDDGVVIAVPEVGGLHHRYERRAACRGLRATSATVERRRNPERLLCLAPTSPPTRPVLTSQEPAAGRVSVWSTWKFELGRSSALNSSL